MGVVVAALFPDCLQSGKRKRGPGAANGRPTPEVVIIGPTGGYPEGCQPDEVAELVMAFFDAYNTGDTAVLDQSFAEPIQWYSDGIEEKEQNHFTTYDRVIVMGCFPILLRGRNSMIN